MTYADEFHHAVTDQYRRIVEYFKPKFMLGLTATPERMDGKNIYEICDYNVPYEISLKEAINKGLLVPFHYYGIYDETDYSGIHLVRGHYEEEELNRAYIGNARRYDMIYKYYKKYPSKQALGFCCSKKHAEDMAREFVKRGVSAAAVYSNGDGEYAMERKEAIEKLKAQELNIIFCVDMFNEGLDIASLDMVLFLRPTESPIVFLQQLGRGLRTYRGKAYLNVLDFIGNYEKAGQAPLLLGGGRAFAKENPSDYQKIEYPDDCLVDFDMRLIDLFREMESKKWKLEERIAAEYMRIRELLGKVPSRMDLFTYMEDAVYERCVTTASKNPFRNYLSYIEKMGDLDEDEKQLKETIGREFLTTLETTNMSKVYKMPVLLSFCEEGSVRMEITEEQVLQAWKAFFYRGTNWKDFNPKGTFEEFKAITDAQHLTKIKKMPVHFLKQSGNGYFVDKEGYLLALREEMSACVDNEALFKHMRDIIEYRTMEYYRRRYEGKL